MRLAIVALGPSWHDYVHLTEAAGGRHAIFDQTWVINSFGNVLDHDMVWHMDDIRVQEARAAAGNVKIANMLAWLKKHRPQARMTGSGACVFAEFETEAEARALHAAALRDLPGGMQGFVARGLDVHPLHDRSD